ncbi:hypothetical protein SLEP1_g13925 [Rubroshorea leprosula]|uniref:Uncharacterized protein n=1 Tax=Rubroshorea leprosula TaxID=152421 RepID=A0AAV5IQE1_9ROSI|nr:hypothetical protein SLEP1_g13925 [Rubroshorea leprosula]
MSFSIEEFQMCKLDIAVANSLQRETWGAQCLLKPQLGFDKRAILLTTICKLTFYLPKYCFA